MPSNTPNLPRPAVQEQVHNGLPGLPFLFLSLLLMLGFVFGLIYGIVFVETGQGGGGWLVALGAVALLAGILIASGLTIVAPGEARVLQFFGRYVGTIRESGYRWVNPFTSRRKVSTRIRNHETSVLKVNDADGNPIEIAAVVVWQVVDTAEAVFEVDDFVQFVNVQAETAVRQIANAYPYDAHGDGQRSLRDDAEEITSELEAQITARVHSAGVKVIESRITHLAYAQEIAQAMLQRQQASAVVAARTKIVEGAVGMVELALERLTAHGVVALDEERKAAMVSNLMVVLCAHQTTQPVINTGSLYH